ncbi:hypothetical protein [Bittarella massiliensis (ex Durand et al. 2017)]|uniref:hypothetical protein n=1 Tax=Bittarella massiliensis (ex Durand et al. 2017) TaxID=1720313 RepID=UPI0034A032EC
MPISEARKRANQAYIDKQDEIKVRVPKGKKEEIKAHAESRGESVNGFVSRAITETMERDRENPINNTCIPRVVRAVAGEDYLLYCYFDDGRITCKDMKPLIGKGVFSPLVDPSVFASALTVMHGTAAWDFSGRCDPTDCVDLDPLTLYEQPAVLETIEVDREEPQ